MANLIKNFQNTEVVDQKSTELLGSIIRKEFDQTESEDRASELLNLAWKYQVPQFEEMLSDFKFTDFKSMF